jgi:hypothetical protein
MFCMTRIPDADEMARDEPDAVRFRNAYARLKIDPEFAIGEFKDLANAGSLLSMLQLGDAYKLGIGVEANIGTAEQYYRRAADAGSLLAYYFLGRLRLRQKRFDEAFSAFNYASGKGYPPATHFLGRLYCWGIGVTKDTVRGEALLRRAAERGSAAAVLALSTSLLQNSTTGLRLVIGLWLRFIGLVYAIGALILEGPKSDRLR